MKSVALDELDEKTSQWLREASQHDGVVVTDHGKAIVTVQPIEPANWNGGGLQYRLLLPEFAAMMNQQLGGTDSTEIISQDREDRL